MDDEDPEEDPDHDRILQAWVDLGRPGARLVSRYIGIPEARVSAVLRQQTAQQAFAAPWKSEGKITATSRNDVWQVDILDNTSRNPSENQGFKYAVIIVDVWSREVCAVPVRVKTPQQSIEALMVGRRWFGAYPKTLETDAGTEFRGHFEDFCREKSILHVTRDVDHQNGLAVVDSAILRLRRAIGKEQVDRHEPGWVMPLERAVRALNKRPGRLGISANALRTRHPVTDFLMDLNAGKEKLAQTRVMDKTADRLRNAGRFRVMLSKDQRVKSGNPSFSGEVHKVRAVAGTIVTDDRGNRFRIWLVRPVVGGGSTVYPKSVRPRNEVGDEQKRAKIFLLAEALQAHIGDDRVSMREAGRFLNTLPGWRQNKVSIPELLDLFPELFRVDGRGHDILISSRVGGDP